MTEVIMKLSGDLNLVEGENELFNIGDLVYLKTTGEVGTVVNTSIEERGPLEIIFPRIDKEGRVEHVPGDMFHEFEIETKEDKLRRELNDIVLEQQIRVEAKETFDKWSEARENVIPMPPPQGRVQ